MSFSVTTTHTSDPVQKLFGDLMFGAETFDKGVGQILPGFHNKISLNRFVSATNKIIAAIPTPSNAVSSITKDEKAITMNEIMWYDEINPKDFDVDRKWLQTVGPSVSAENAAVIMSAVRETVVQAFNKDLDQLLWNGDTQSGSAWLSPIDGFVKLIDADGTVNSCVTSGAVTSANVIAVLEK